MAQSSEKKIEEAILTYLNYQPGCYAFKVNTVGIYDQRKRVFRRISKWIIRGTADILCCYRGFFIAFEVKSEKGKQTSYQKEFERDLKLKGHGHYFLVRSIIDVENALRSITVNGYDTTS